MNVKPKTRTEWICIRCTPEEKKVLTETAKAMGISVTKLLLVSAYSFADFFYRTIRGM